MADWSSVDPNSDPNNCNITMADLLPPAEKTGKENYEHKANSEPARTVVVVNKNGRLGSVYSQVSKTLARQGGWRRKKNPTGRFHMVFGEAHGAGIPYKRFSQTFRYDYGICPLVNYYRSAKAVTDKVMMCQTLKQHASEGKEQVSFLPESFLFWPGKEDVSQHAQFQDAFDRIAASGDSQNIWIVKPANTAHGNDIFLSRDAEEILEHIADQREGSGAWLVQKYCENPMLLSEGRKFDVRVWVLIDHNFDIHFYKHGSVRTSCEPFSVRDLRNRYIHLTNHSIQESHPDFGRFEKNGEMFFEEFSSFLADNTQFTLDGDIVPQMHNIVKTTLIAAKSTMESIDGVDDYKSFMLFGFDMLVDAAGKVWLLEVNGAPAVAKDLLAGLAEDLITTAIDPLFERDYAAAGGKARDNGFERIYQSTGKCATVTNMPAPTTGVEDNCEVEMLGADEGKRSTGSASRK